MKERPILFSAPMVRAILDGRKTQTRRIVKPALTGTWDPPNGPEDVAAGYPFVETDDGHVSAVTLCPYGKPGDRLWVRETSMPAIDAGGADYRYAADYDADGRRGMASLQRWTPSIHMPRKACRIELEVTGVRVERLQDISEADAIAEGCKGFNSPPTHNDDVSPREEYRDLWQTINGAGSWDANPWVWVVEFKRVQAQAAAA